MTYISVTEQCELYLCVTEQCDLYLCVTEQCELYLCDEQSLQTNEKVSISKYVNDMSV